METNSPLSLKEINSGQKYTIQEGFLHTPPHQEVSQTKFCPVQLHNLFLDEHWTTVAFYGRLYILDTEMDYSVNLGEKPIKPHSKTLIYKYIKLKHCDPCRVS